MFLILILKLRISKYIFFRYGCSDVLCSSCLDELPVPSTALSPDNTLALWFPLLMCDFIASQKHRGLPCRLPSLVTHPACPHIRCPSCPLSILTPHVNHHHYSPKGFSCFPAKEKPCPSVCPLPFLLIPMRSLNDP